MIHRALIRSIVVAFVASPAMAQVQTHTYAEINGNPLLLNFYPPTTASVDPAPLILWIHGGGWISGTRMSTGNSLSLRQHGFAVASVDYRLTSQTGQWGDAPVTWPAQAHDVKAAVRYLRANAEVLNIDPCAFISWGSSAGGHLSAILGTSNGHPTLEGEVGDHLEESSDVQLAVDYFGPTDLLFMNADVTNPPGSMIDHDALNSPESILLGANETGFSVGDIREHIGDPNDPWPELVTLARSAAPARLARHAPSNVPFLIAHGEDDTSVAIGQSQRLHDALVDVGMDSTFMRIEGAGHGLPPSVADDVRVWLEAQLPGLGSCRCATDLNSDGSSDFFDVSVLLNQQFDFNGDTSFDFFDISAFLQALTKGCP